MDPKKHKKMYSMMADQLLKKLYKVGAKKADDESGEDEEDDDDAVMPVPVTGTKVKSASTEEDGTKMAGANEKNAKEIVPESIGAQAFADMFKKKKIKTRMGGMMTVSMGAKGSRSKKMG